MFLKQTRTRLKDTCNEPLSLRALRVSNSSTLEEGKNAPTILISPGTGGHAYVFVELGYRMHLRGYNVFIMPKHCGSTIRELMARHKDALEHIVAHWNDRIGVFSEGLGGYIVFYLALTQSPMKSVVFQNAPAILTEEKFRAAMLQGKGAAHRRKIILPFGKLLLSIVPSVKLPISSYLDWKELIDTKEGNRAVETRLVIEGYLHDPDFDKWYPLSAIMSLLLTPPPQPLTALHTLRVEAAARTGGTAGGGRFRTS